MKIYFENDAGLLTINDYAIGSKGRLIIEQFKSFVETRLKLLQDEIDKEPRGYIVINIGLPQIRYYYSDRLKEKILESITEEDFRYISTKIYLELNRQ